MSSHGYDCKGSKTAYFLEIKRKRDGVRSSIQMQREQDNFLEVERKCDGVKWWSRTTYSLNVERKHDEVRSWWWTQREQDDVLPGGEERA
jgi:hypothetical protein